MKDETGEHRRKLCEQEAVEQDSDRLLELVRELNRCFLRNSSDSRTPRLSNYRTQVRMTTLPKVNIADGVVRA